MASAVAEYVYGYCDEYADQLPDWDWVKSKRAYRNKMFKNTHLYVGPGKLTFGGGFSASTGQSFIKISNRYFSKVTKTIFGDTSDFYYYQIHGYYHTFKGEVPKDQPNYAFMVPVIKESHEKSRVEYSHLSEFPNVLGHIFERGKAIFDENLNYNSEVELLKSAILPVTTSGFFHRARRQVILRLMIDGDVDFIDEVRRNFDTPGVKESLLKIEPHIDDIIANSPYID